MQRTDVLAGGELSIGCRRFRAGLVAEHFHDRVQCGIDRVDAGQMSVHDFDRAQLSLGDASRQFGGRELPDLAHWNSSVFIGLRVNQSHGERARRWLAESGPQPDGHADRMSAPGVLNSRRFVPRSAKYARIELTEGLWSQNFSQHSQWLVNSMLTGTGIA